jgi:outer membrane assembly lipoprotein YfiO
MVGRQTSRAGALVGVALLLCVSMAAQAWTWNPATGRWINEKRLPKETAQLQVEHARSLMLEGDYKKAIRETNKFEEYYSDTDWADDNQFVRGEIRHAQGKYMDAANEFQQVVTNYPDSDLYDTVIKKQYEMGDQFYALGQTRADKRWHLFKKRPYERAIEVYGMVIDNQPFSPQAAEAQYKVGLCHFSCEEYVEAAYEYQRVQEDYAGSEWVTEASHGLAMCYYEASLEPEYDQAPSLLAIRAFDEFKERFSKDERVGDLTGKRVEMREKVAMQRLKTARFYEKRRKFDAARIYYEVVVEQFPETAACAEAKEELSRGKAKGE